MFAANLALEILTEEYYGHGIMISEPYFYEACGMEMTARVWLNAMRSCGTEVPKVWETWERTGD